MPSIKPEEDISGLKAIIFIVGGALSMGIGYYVEVGQLVPVMVAGVLWILLDKAGLQSERDAMIPAFAFQAGHVVWLAVGYLEDGAASMLPVAVLVAFGLAWLMARPGGLPVFVLCLLQLFLLGFGLVDLLDEPLGTHVHKVHTMHVFLHLVSVGFMTDGYFRFRKLESEDAGA